MRQEKFKGKAATLLAIGFVQLALASGAAAQGVTEQQVRWCTGNESAPFDQQLAACNAAIQSGRWSGRELAWAFVNRGSVYLGLKDYDRALADYNEAMRLDPRSAPATIHGRGAVYAAKKDYDRAIVDYNESIRLDPRSALAFADRGSAYHNKGDYTRAIADYDQAIALKPDHAVAYFNRALAHEELGNRERAIADYRMALSLGYTDAADDLRRLGVTP